MAYTNTNLLASIKDRAFFPVGQDTFEDDDILRIASEEDIGQAAGNRNREREAFLFCRERIHPRGMDMKLVRAEYAFDGSKIRFHARCRHRAVAVTSGQLRHEWDHLLRKLAVRDHRRWRAQRASCGRSTWDSSIITPSFYRASRHLLRR